MALDLVVLVLLFLYAVSGFVRGLMAQLVGLAGIVAVWLLAPPLAPWCRRLLFSSSSDTLPHHEIASLLIVAAVILIVVQLLSSSIPDLLRRWSDAVRSLDSTFGTVLGVVRGSLTLYLCLCAMVYVESPLQRQVPDLGRQMRASQVYAEVKRNNLLTDLRFQDLERLRVAIADYGASESGAETSSSAQALKALPISKETLVDGRLIKMAREKRYSELLENASVRSLLADPAVLRLLHGLGAASMVDEAEIPGVEFPSGAGERGRERP